MCRKQKFYLCERCQNLVGLIDDHGVPLVCCGGNMTELIPNTVEASEEKHLPAVALAGDKLKVEVGSVLHPMVAEHYIAFVYVETVRGGQRKCLEIGSEPSLEFSFVYDTPTAVYAYCNLHGMWKTEL